MKTLKEALANKEFIITAELCPPKGTNVAEFLEKARVIKGKVHAVNVTDNQRAIMRLGSLSASALLVQGGIQPVLQMTCRDRNRIALQSDLIGAHALGIKNILALTGDHITSGDHSEAKPVFDLEAVQLLQAVQRLNAGEDIMGNPLDGKTDLFPGAVVNPGAQPLEPQLIKFEKKVEAGAKFFQTQAIYDIDSFAEFMKFARNFDVAIFAGILLLKSAKMAKFLNKHVAGISVNKRVIDLLDKSGNPLKTGIEFAASQIRELKGACHGVHIMTVGMEEHVSKILELI